MVHNFVYYTVIKIFVVIYWKEKKNKLYQIEKPNNFLPLRFVNDQPIEPGLKFHTDQRKGLTGDVTHSLSIDSTEVEHQGKVKAVATNKAGDTESVANLTVEGMGNLVFINIVIIKLQRGVNKIYVGHNLHILSSNNY